MVENGEVKEDKHQIDALKELDRLYKQLEQSGPTKVEWDEQPPSTGILGGWFSRVKKRASTRLTHYHKGVYLHGGVGCGKTFCMNLFYDQVNGKWAQDKQHVHFHKFMLGVHQQVRLESMNKVVNERVRFVSFSLIMPCRCTRRK